MPATTTSSFVIDAEMTLLHDQLLVESHCLPFDGDIPKLSPEKLHKRKAEEFDNHHKYIKAETATQNDQSQQAQIKSETKRLRTSTSPITSASRPRRESKPVERLTVPVREEKAKPQLEIVAGPGIQLRHIVTAVNKRIGVFKSLEPEIRLMFKAAFPNSKIKPNKHTIKKYLREFSGFDCQHAAEMQQLSREMLEKDEDSQVRLVADICDVLSKGTKQQVVENIIKFLVKPVENPENIKTSTRTYTKPQDPQYEIAEIIGQKFDGKQMLYHVLWKNYPLDMATWECLRNVENTQALFEWQEDNAPLQSQLPEQQNHQSDKDALQHAIPMTQVVQPNNAPLQSQSSISDSEICQFCKHIMNNCDAGTFTLSQTFKLFYATFGVDDEATRRDYKKMIVAKFKELDKDRLRTHN
jgi:hypothetical protein